MPEEKQTRRSGTILKCATLGLVLISAAACVAEPYPPSYRQGYYPDAYDRYYDYPSAYSGDYNEFNARRNADERNGWGHADDRNFHNHDDYQQYDR